MKMVDISVRLLCASLLPVMHKNQILAKKIGAKDKSYIINKYGEKKSVARK